MNINTNQLFTSLTMQDDMNKTINPAWATQGWDYMRASMLESCEAIEHHGWKWWKHQEKDLPQLQMELVDIWHFILSRYLQLHSGHIETSKNVLLLDFKNQQEEDIVFDGGIYKLEDLSLLQKLDLLVGLSASKRINLKLFFSLCEECELNWNELFKQYIQKNLLNIFRQKNGYKQGTYEKNWFDKEDNVFLVSESEKLDPASETYATDLWNSLENTYKDAVIYRAEKNTLSKTLE